MIALAAPAVPHTDPRAMAPDARLAELAQLLARGLVRARVANTAPMVANVALGADPTPSAPGPKALALSPEAERACDRRERRDDPARGSPTTPPREDDL